ncbi:hypothetical protein D9619_004608 [Psilocybe cf. subviscida]|uniref:F-box domain-containing protein n=1 Tax=Psilocybe cf. subviscida TaxID=2480587 RepID=A0A8H5BPB4_9AGAR|nr:hypothetical protein D9619_004608 [Psilocybe cf. subviscida]
MSNTTAFSRIPNEVFHHILKHQSANADLCSASLTCRALRDEAQRILFHNPVPLTAYRHLIFIDVILSSPDRLGPMVRTFVHVSGSAYCEGKDEVLTEKTRKLLRAMCNLKRLAFQNAKKLPASVLLGTTFQLDAFDWGSAHDATVVFNGFLPTQTSLKHLTFHCEEELATLENMQLATTLCPELQSLTGGRKAIKLFLKRKNKVTHLHFLPDSIQESAWFPAPELQVEFGRLQFLKFRSWDEQFTQLPRLLHSLVLLELTKSHSGSDNLKLQAMLPNMTSLRVLILVDFVTQTQMPRNSNYPGDIARDMLGWCPHLEFIDISINATRGAQHFRRFYQEDAGDAEMTGAIIDSDTVFAWRRKSEINGA